MEKARKSGNKNMKYSEAFEEFVADSMEKMLTDQNAVEKLAMLRTKDKSVFDKLREGIQKLVDRIKQEYSKLAPDSAEGRTVAKMTDVFGNIQDLFLEALDDASNNFQKAEKNTATDDGVKYSVKSFADGKQYVKADRQVFSGNDPKKWGEQVANYINNTIRNGKDVIVYALDGDALTITENTAGKAAFRNDVKLKDGTSQPMTDEEYAVKLRAESHIDELSQVSRRGKKTVPDYKRHSFAKDGFNYRTAFFMDADGKYYRLTLSVGKNGVINTVYNVGKIKEEGEYSLRGSKPVTDNSVTMRSPSSNNSVPQENTTVNNNSMQENENNTQKKFSLRENVEETKKLVAVHNLSAEKLLKSLNLGGLPMPSIAIMKAKDGHNQFGDISLVFRKDTIDPEADKSNKVYSGDAWTPTYPRTEYKVNEDVASKIYHRARSAGETTFFKPVHFHPDNIERQGTVRNYLKCHFFSGFGRFLAFGKIQQLKLNIHTKADGILHHRLILL